MLGGSLLPRAKALAQTQLGADLRLQLFAGPSGALLYTALPPPMAISILTSDAVDSSRCTPAYEETRERNRNAEEGRRGRRMGTSANRGTSANTQASRLRSVRLPSAVVDLRGTVATRPESVLVSRSSRVRLASFSEAGRRRTARSRERVERGRRRFRRRGSELEESHELAQVPALPWTSCDGAAFPSTAMLPALKRRLFRTYEGVR